MPYYFHLLKYPFKCNDIKQKSHNEFRDGFTISHLTNYFNSKTTTDLAGTSTTNLLPFLLAPEKFAI